MNNPFGNVSYKLEKALNILNTSSNNPSLIDMVKGDRRDIPWATNQRNDNSWEVSIRGQMYALTGSRYFEGKRGPDVDWDFFTSYSEDTIRYLEGLGFHKIYGGNCDYDDADVLYVYRYKEGIDTEDVNAYYLYEKGQFQIDIQLVKDYSRRLIIRNVLYDTYLPWKSISKNKRNALWNAAYTLSMLPSPFSLR